MPRSRKLINLWKRKTSVNNNLTEEERLALDALQKREDIVIYQADKGGKTVIMNKSDYIKEMESMLTDKEFYQEENDKTAEYAAEIKQYIQDLGDLVSKKERKFLLDDLEKPRTPVFYGLPKIHKQFKTLPPMRPIVSGYNSVTVKMSEFVDSFLKVRAQKCNSYIKDTNDFLTKIRDLKDFSPKSILVTMDVSSLYTNIDQSEGAEACFESLEQRSHKTIPSTTLRDMIKLVLERNIFRFTTPFLLPA